MSVTQITVGYILKLWHLNASLCQGPLGSYPSLQTGYHNRAFCFSFPQTFQEAHGRYLRIVQIAFRYISFTDILPCSTFWVGLTKLGMWLCSGCDSSWVERLVFLSLCADWHCGPSYLLFVGYRERNVVLTACLHLEGRFKHWQSPNHYSWHDCVSAGHQYLHFAFILQCEPQLIWHH